LYSRHVAIKARADIANTAARIFLQDFGAAYDEMRGLPKYTKGKHFPAVRAFFDERCCYCGVEFGPGHSAVEDHLIPMSQKELGLHAWGNIVAACAACNAVKQARTWHEVVAERAGPDAAERYKRIQEFVKFYKYAPAFDLGSATADLYAEVGEVAMALIRIKVQRLRATL
jgi:5-methylcytosine-specific restriction endonuclease McrA